MRGALDHEIAQGVERVGSENKSGNEQRKFLCREIARCILDTFGAAAVMLAASLLAHFTDAKAEAQSDIVTALRHVANEPRCWTPEVQVPDHSPMASLKPSGLLRNKIAPNNLLCPPKQNSWSHLIFMLRKPAQSFTPTFP